MMPHLSWVYTKNQGETTCSPTNQRGTQKGGVRKREILPHIVRIFGFHADLQGVLMECSWGSGLTGLLKRYILPI